jgi:hypothetical protein
VHPRQTYSSARPLLRPVLPKKAAQSTLLEMFWRNKQRWGARQPPRDQILCAPAAPHVEVGRLSRLPALLERRRFVYFIFMNARWSGPKADPARPSGG